MIGRSSLHLEATLLRHEQADPDVVSRSDPRVESPAHRGKIFFRFGVNQVAAEALGMRYGFRFPGHRML